MDNDSYDSIVDRDLCVDEASNIYVVVQLFTHCIRSASLNLIKYA
jgi:hypothetical protein